MHSKITRKQTQHVHSASCVHVYVKLRLTISQPWDFKYWAAALMSLTAPGQSRLLIKWLASSLSVAIFPRYRSGTIVTNSPVFPMSCASSLICLFIPHHSWMTTNPFLLSTKGSSKITQGRSPLAFSDLTVTFSPLIVPWMSGKRQKDNFNYLLRMNVSIWIKILQIQWKINWMKEKQRKENDLVR